MTTVIVEGAKRTDARERMIRSAAVLFRERGVEGTSFNDVLAHSGAPRGSIYHHFPGGKAQLAEEATRYAGEVTAAGLAAALADEDPAAAIAAFAETWRRLLRKSDFAAGCPVMAAALEGGHLPATRAAASAAFARWQDQLAAAFRKNGVPRQRSESLAALAIAAIEGAVVLARAQGTSEPLEQVAGELERLATEAIQEER